jgi:CRP/FNR family transcriptional regulator
MLETTPVAALSGDDPMENKVWYLQRSRLFAEVPETSVASSEHLFVTCLFPKRALVFDQGDSARVVYLIKRGKVRLSRLTQDGKEVTIAILGAGDFFGEETLFEAGSRTTIATCLEETLLCSARADDLFALLSADPTLALNVAKMLSTRLGDASATMEDLAYAKVPDRLMHLFARLAHEHGVPEAGDAVKLDMRLTHAEIASLIGSTRETVSLELSNLARAGRIAIRDGAIVVPRAELEAL